MSDSLASMGYMSEEDEAVWHDASDSAEEGDKERKILREICTAYMHSGDSDRT